MLKVKHVDSVRGSPQDQEGLSPLHWAVMCDQAAHVRVLLTSTPADVRIQDNEGRTPLNYAVLNFSPSCIKVREWQGEWQGGAKGISSKGPSQPVAVCGAFFINVTLQLQGRSSEIIFLPGHSGLL